MSTDEAVGADRRAIKHCAADANQRMIADSASMQHHPVANCYAVADTQWKSRVGMQDAAVLDVAAGTDLDKLVIAADDGVEPDAGLRLQADLAQATDYSNRIPTSQLAISAAACNTVYRDNPDYLTSLTNLSKFPLDGDMIFADNTPKQLSAQTLAMTGEPETSYRGEVTIGLEI